MSMLYDVKIQKANKLTFWWDHDIVVSQAHEHYDSQNHSTCEDPIGNTKGILPGYPVYDW